MVWVYLLVHFIGSKLLVGVVDLAGLPVGTDGGRPCVVTQRAFLPLRAAC